MKFLPSIFRSAPAPQPAERVEPTTLAPMPAGRIRGAMARAGRAVRMVIDGAAVTRLTADWPSHPVPADWIVRRNQRALVARSREQLFSNDFFKAYARLCRQNIVGASGIVFQSKARTRGGKPDKNAKAAIERAHRDWSRRENCDVTGRMSWRAIQNACVQSLVTDGEFFLRKLVGARFGKYGFQLQLLDPIRCPVEYDRNDLANGAFIRHGIEFNAYGKPVAYHFLDSGAKDSDQGYSWGGRDFRRIPADEIVHDFLAEVPQQKRGLPWMSTGLFRLKQMGAFEDAAIVNARVGAGKLGVVEFEEGKGPECNDLAEADEMPEISGEPGTLLVLPNGGKLNKFEPTYPSGEFAVFIKAMLRSIAAGGGVSYHNLAQDLEGVNFSSIRQGTLDEREHFKELQEQLIDGMVDPVTASWLEQALLRKKIVTDTGSVLAAAHIDRYSDCEFQGRRWEWIDPNADMKAAEGRKNNLLASPGSIIREGGKDPSVVYAEIAEDIAAMKAAGIPENIIEMAMGLKIAPPPKEAPNNA